MSSQLAANFKISLFYFLFWPKEIKQTPLLTMKRAQNDFNQRYRLGELFLKISTRCRAENFREKCPRCMQIINESRLRSRDLRGARDEKGTRGSSAWSFHLLE